MSLIGADVTVPNGERKSVFAAEGETVTVDGRVTVSENGRLAKTGAGEVVLKTSRIVQSVPLAVDVLGGTLTVTNDVASAQPTVAAPTDILNTATLWLKAESLSGSTGDGVTVWRDCRDTDASVTNYPFARSSGTYGYPSLGVSAVNGLSFVDFGKYSGGSASTVGGGSGMLALVKKDNTAQTLKSGSLYAMLDVKDYWGCVWGWTSQSEFNNGDYNDGKVSNKRAYFGEWSGPETRCGRFYVNGVRTDTMLQQPANGVQLIEFHHAVKPDLTISSASVSALFARKNIRHGGGRVFELLFFPKVLSEADALAVQTYLLQKYRVPMRANKPTVNLADGVTLRVDDATNVVLRGTGTIEPLASASVMSLGREPFFAGKLCLTNGVNGAVMPDYGVEVSLADGDSIDVTRAPGSGYGWQKATLSAGTAGAITKTGAGNVRLTGVPAGTHELVVSGGRVTLAPPLRQEAPVACTNDIYATIPNASFESATSTTGWESKYGTLTSYGWTVYSEGGGFYSHKIAAAAGKDVWPSNYDSPDGNWSLLLKNASTRGKDMAAWTTVTVPVTGRYELSFASACRNDNNDYDGHAFRILFVSGDGSVTNDCGSADAESLPYRYHKILTPVIEAGSWTMRIVLNRATVEGGSLFDDFRMKLVTDPEPEGVWPLPNGSFETLAYGGMVYVRSLTNSISKFADTRLNTLENWTLTQGGLGVTGEPDVALSTEYHAISRHNPNFPAREGNRHLVFFADGGKATSAAFVPPAGRWRVRFKFARHYSQNADYKGSGEWHGVFFNQKPVMRAVATVNGTEVDLGELTDSGFNAVRTVTSTNLFTTATGDAVTIRLRQTVPAFASTVGGAAATVSAAAYVDDVELVRDEAVGANLIANGNFETAPTWTAGQGWERHVPAGVSKPDDYVGRMLYSSMPEHFGYDRYDGSYRLQMRNAGQKAWQRVTVPAAGLYRFTFHAHKRADTLYLNYENKYLPLRVWVQQGGETNELAFTRVDGNTFRTYSYWWKAPAAGQYDIGFTTARASELGDTDYDDMSVFIDGVSLTAADHEVAAEAPSVPEELEVSLATGAHLALEFPGQLPVKAFRINGRCRRGIINAQRFPGVVSGTGSLSVPREGMCIIVR